jgi:hypothetical protein
MPGLSSPNGEENERWVKKMNRIQNDEVIATQRKMIRIAEAGIIITFIFAQIINE